MRLIITGGCGFVGFNLAKFMVEYGHQVTVFDNLTRPGSETNVPRLKKLGIKFIHGDIRNSEDFLALPNDGHCLIECSAQPSVVSGYENPIFDFRTNVEGVINCLEFCRKSEAGMIFFSSNRVYPAEKINTLPHIETQTRWDWDPLFSGAPLPIGFDPIRGISAEFSMDGATKTIYGASKAAADFFCQEYTDAFGLPVIINRCGVISGQGQFGVVSQGWLAFWAISCFFERPVFYFGYKGKQVRDIIFIEDICDLVVIQLNRLEELSGRVWNVGGGRENSLSLVEATAIIEQIMEKNMIVALKNQKRKNDMIIYITDNNAISTDLNWHPSIPITQGVQKITNWIRDNKNMLISAGL